ncbi:MAG TPA: hypothetical protein DET40_25480 [Lentisphaeria bacterium]|nr:MAG: hypothetical protein A2X45_18485 [Lentisphaerae bacterium GWF2_50_93]HCE46913.1 hypothetical protein [Lentisphaeria bacterium]
MNKQNSNILLILTDQHRLSAVGAYGDTPCRTPNIDRIAKEGILFQNAYTTCPVCSPARASIMTGLYPHTHGMSGNVHDLTSAVHELHDKPSLLSRRLQERGYKLGYTGKWHLGTDSQTVFMDRNSPSLPKDVGFEGQNFPGHGDGGFQYPEYRKYLKDHGFQHKVRPWSEKTRQAREGACGILDGPVESTIDHFITDETISLMSRFKDDGRPFFMWQNFWGPHVPCFVTEEYWEMYRNVPIPEWPNYRWPSRATPGPHNARISPDHENLTWEDWATAMRYYYGFTSMIDAEIGRVLDYLDKSGLSENTAVVFAADHGETMGSHGGLIDKGFIHFEETHRIPFIIRMPGGKHKGEFKREFISLADLYPTVLELAGCEYDNRSVHGSSILPLIEGNAREWREDIVVEFSGVSFMGSTMRTIRHGNIKYGYACGFGDELYDLDSDPYEMKNLACEPSYAERANDMRKRLLAWMAKTRDPLRPMFQRACRYYFQE